MVVGLGDGLGRPVLVDRADLELLEVAAVGMAAGGLAGRLVGLDRRTGVLIGHFLLWILGGREFGGSRRRARCAGVYRRAAGQTVAPASGHMTARVEAGGPGP